MAVKIAEVTVPKVHARTHLTEVKVASSLTHPNVVCGPHLVALLQLANKLCPAHACLHCACAHFVHLSLPQFGMLV